MPDPTIRGFGGTNSGLNVTQTDVDIVARTGVTPRVGDITLIAIVKDGTGAFTWPSGWTSLSGLPVTFASTNNQGVFDVRYRKCVADGEATTISITHASEGTAHQVYVIDGSAALEGVPEGATANGDSTNPDPPNLAQSWGAKTNTLYIVFACNDGNTAITAGPASYTNFQNDRWANTNGVGIATARRATNGASENPGVFTMATEQWAAVTVGFNPGTVLTDPLVKEGIEYPDRIYRNEYRQGLSIGVNLLQSTLAPVSDSPFIPQEWKNPERKGGLIVGLSSRPQEDANTPIIPPIYANPDAIKALRLTWLNNNLQDNLKPGEIPFYQNEWPNPLIGRKPTLSHIFSPQLETPTSPPFTPIDYPNPKIGARNQVRFETSRPQFYQDIQPFAQYNWPNPAPKKLKHETWLVNLQQTTLAPPVVTAPFSTPDFNLPVRKGGLIVHISSYINVAPPTQPPFVNEVVLQLPRTRRFNPVWYQSRPFYYQDIKPFTQIDWPNPKQLFKPPNTWIYNRKLDEPTVLNPFIPVDFPNPRLKPRMNPDWTFLAPFQQIFTYPVGNSSYDVPSLRRKPEPNTWIQQTPTFYPTAVAGPPFTSVLLIPPPKRYLAHTLIVTRQLTSIVGTPFAQNQWPNPSLKRKPTELYEFFYVIDDNLPQSSSILDNPRLRRERPNVGWVQSLRPTEGTPLKTYDYPNPIRLKRPTVGHIDNLLGSTLFPTPGAVPFYQNDWPNPILGKKNFHSGWIQEKRFYYIEPSIFNAQYDWPVYRAIVRNFVGHIQYRIPSEIPPKVANIVEVPPTKRRNNITWIYNSLIDLTALTGQVPFKQTEWPLPLRAKSNRELLTFINQLSPGLISVVGRNICMLSSVLEYYLDSTEVDYELESQATDYQIDSGGSECQ